MVSNHSHQLLRTQWNVFAFSFRFMDLKFTTPYPNDMQPTVCIFRLGCNSYEALIHVHNWLMISAPMILLSFIVCFWYCNTHINSSFSSLVLLVTLVHRNDISVSMLGFPIFLPIVLFATIECRMSAYFSSSIL